MINIRNNIFETNSSSSHSLVIFKGDYKTPEHIEYVRDNVLDIYWDNDLEFGRAPFDLLTNWYRRLCYAIASCPDRIEEIEEACYRHVPGLEEIKYPKNRWNDNESPYYGYIDHQSLGLLEGFMNKYNLSFDDFIFNDRYMVVIDGDEYCIFDTLIKTPAWDNSKVEEIYG